MSAKSAIFLSSILIVSFILVLDDSIVSNASAALDCEVEGGAPVWNTTVARHALKPEMTNEWYMEEGKGRHRAHSSQPTTNSEEFWLWDSNRPPVKTLENDLFASMTVENDTSGSLRFNLSKDYRYTFCITISQPQGSTDEADIYLMTSTEYETYRTDYAVNHMEDSWWHDDEEDISSIPPEWRSFNSVAGWNSFRDSHDYENKEEVSFSVTLDDDLIWKPIFTNQLTWEEFYIVIDKWDNSRSEDSQPNGVDALVDVSVVVEERGFVLPPWTVSLTCLVLFFAVGAVPVILNSRYMKAGLSFETKAQGLVPQLTSEEE